MLGAIAGDIFGAAYEFDPESHENVDLFERHRFFTDDTVLTIATADALMTDGDYTRASRVGPPLPELHLGRPLPRLALRRRSQPIQLLRQRLRHACEARRLVL